MKYLGNFKVYVNGELVAEGENIVYDAGQNRLLTVNFDEPIQVTQHDELTVNYYLREEE